MLRSSFLKISRIFYIQINYSKNGARTVGDFCLASLASQSLINIHTISRAHVVPYIVKQNK